ncbi:MAG: ECF transporter S component [Oscillibacter ruminantium]|uniref:ECF transporter S component n=1 Tax=Oscillibacter ruminantium TaxID=1263547 RepID=UPI002B21DEE4|nr:ECF transporter S component [Oscillibacter ruminantium]MEA5042913.1 ECF transporter S component [Oscillibacter ruminantium]
MKQTTIKKHIQRLVLAAMFLALGIVLPFLTGQIPQVGSMLLPMHLPVLLCGLICGWQYGGAVGLVLPLLRYVMFGMPPIFPTGIAMTFELAAYGAIAGFLYNRSKWQCVFALYRSLLIAMAGGRIIWGVVRVLLTGVAGEAFTWQMFMAGAFLNAIPGIVLQLVFIPVLMVALDRTGMVRFSRSHTQIAEN